MLKKIRQLFFISLIDGFIFIFLYIMVVMPFMQKNNCNYNGTIINYYHQKVDKTEYGPFFKQMASIDVWENQFIRFDDVASLQITRNNRHQRAVGQLSVGGSYDTEESLNKFLKELDNKKMDGGYRNNRFIIPSTNNSVIYLFLEPNNKIRVDIRTGLLYSLNNVKEDADEIDYYFIEKIKNYRAVVKKALTEIYHNICIIILLVDIIIVGIYLILHL